MRLSLLLLLLNVFQIFSQEDHSMLVEYEFVTSLNGNSSIRDASLMTLDNYKSQYVVYGKKSQDSEFKQSENDDMKYTKTFEISDGQNAYMLTDLRKKTIEYNSKIGKKKYLIIDSIPYFNWILESDKKHIGNYICNKATLNFRGRSYIAWYSSDIPISHGPWKFYGLPGLIIEISDTKNNYRWRVKKITYPYIVENEINFDSFELNEISIKDYIILLDKNSERTKQILMSRMPSGTEIVDGEIEIKRESIELEYEWETE